MLYMLYTCWTCLQPLFAFHHCLAVQVLPGWAAGVCPFGCTADPVLGSTYLEIS